MDWFKKAVKAVVSVAKAVNNIVAAATGKSIVEHVQSWVGGGEASAHITSQDNSATDSSVSKLSQQDAHERQPQRKLPQVEAAFDANQPDADIFRAEARKQPVSLVNDDLVSGDMMGSLRVTHVAYQDDELRPFYNWVARDIDFVSGFVNALGIDEAFRRFTGYDLDPDDMERINLRNRILSAVDDLNREMRTLPSMTMGEAYGVSLGVRQGYQPLIQREVTIENYVPGAEYTEAERDQLLTEAWNRAEAGDVAAQVVLLDLAYGVTLQDYAYGGASGTNIANSAEYWNNADVSAQEFVGNYYSAVTIMASQVQKEVGIMNLPTYASPLSELSQEELFKIIMGPTNAVWRFADDTELGFTDPTTPRSITIQWKRIVRNNDYTDDVPTVRNIIHEYGHVLDWRTDPFGVSGNNPYLRQQAGAVSIGSDGYASHGSYTRNYDAGMVAGWVVDANNNSDQNIAINIDNSPQEDVADAFMALICDDGACGEFITTNGTKFNDTFLNDSVGERRRNLTRLWIEDAITLAVTPYLNEHRRGAIDAYLEEVNPGETVYGQQVSVSTPVLAYPGGPVLIQIPQDSPSVNIIAQSNSVRNSVESSGSNEAQQALANPQLFDSNAQFGWGDASEIYVLVEYQGYIGWIPATNIPNWNQIQTHTRVLSSEQEQLGVEVISITGRPVELDQNTIPDRFTRFSQDLEGNWNPKTSTIFPEGVYTWRGDYTEEEQN